MFNQKTIQRLFAILTIALTIFCFNPAYTQTVSPSSIDTSLHKALDGSNTAEDDDDFNLFLFVLAMAFFGTIIGAAIVGACVSLCLLLLAILCISAGIVSTSVFVGILSRSAKAGFKTLVVITTSVACAIIGSAGLFAVKELFHLSFTTGKSLAIGAAGGAAGGILLGFILFRVLRYLLEFFKKKAGMV